MHNELSPAGVGNSVEFGRNAPRIRLLGVASVWVGTAEVTSFRSSRIPALFGLLATRPGAWLRETVAARLWPDQLCSEGRHNLRQIVLHVNHMLGEDLLRCTYQTVEFAPGVETDIAKVFAYEGALRAHVDQMALAELIVTEYRGEFLVGFLDDWVVGTRARCERIYLSALLDLADHYSTDSPTLSLRYADRATTVDPYLDGARVRKIRALRRLGENSLAQREFISYRDLLAVELGIAPAITVLDELQKAPIQARKSEVTPSYSTGSTFESIEFLVANDQIPDALELGIACVPVWTARRLSSHGEVCLRSLLECYPAERPRHLYHRGLIALANLMYEQGDRFEAKTLIEANELSFDALPSKLGANLFLARLHTAGFQSELALGYVQHCLELADTGDVTLSDQVISALRLGAEANLNLGRLSEAEEMAERCIKLAEQLGDWKSSTSVLTVVCYAKIASGDVSAVVLAVEDAIRLLEDRPGAEAAFTRVRFARVLEEAGVVEMAQNGYERGIAEARKLGDQFGLVVSLTYLGDLLSKQENPGAALEMHEEALSLRSGPSQLLGRATSLRGIGRALIQLERYQEAESALGESASLFDSVGAALGQASSLYELARVAAYNGEVQRAIRLATRTKKLMAGSSTASLRTIGPGAESMVNEVDVLIGTLGNI